MSSKSQEGLGSGKRDMAPGARAEWALWSLCRPGFEQDSRDELHARFSGVLCQRLQSHASGGVVAWTWASAPAPEERALLSKLLKREDGGHLSRGLIFSSDALLGRRVSFPKGTLDRVSAIVAVLSSWQEQTRGAGVVRALSLKVPESTAVPGLERFARTIARPLEQALKAANILRDKPDAASVSDSEGTAFLTVCEAVICFENYESALVTVRPLEDGRKVALRGRTSRLDSSPSRSGAKLVEAFRVFSIKDFKSEKALRAVDLGAAPGGWTAVLRHHGFRVTAVDHGKICPNLLGSSGGLVTHARADAFHFPIDPRVQLLTCDIVERPQQVTDLVLRWLKQPTKRTAVFNLKLPMKKRYLTIESCLGKIHAELSGRGVDCLVDALQLYHDRQEVTVVVKRFG